jgi:hypothetical protein
MHIQSKGGVGMARLKYMLGQYDSQKNGRLDASEFEQALAGFG